MKIRKLIAAALVALTAFVTPAADLPSRNLFQEPVQIDVGKVCSNVSASGTQFTMQPCTTDTDTVADCTTGTLFDLTESTGDRYLVKCLNPSGTTFDYSAFKHLLNDGVTYESSPGTEEFRGVDLRGSIAVVNGGSAGGGTCSALANKITNPGFESTTYNDRLGLFPTHWVRVNTTVIATPGRDGTGSRIDVPNTETVWTREEQPATLTQCGACPGVSCCDVSHRPCASQGTATGDTCGVGMSNGGWLNYITLNKNTTYTLTFYAKIVGLTQSSVTFGLFAHNAVGDSDTTNTPRYALSGVTSVGATSATFSTWTLNASSVCTYNTAAIAASGWTQFTATIDTTGVGGSVGDPFYAELLLTGASTGGGTLEYDDFEFCAPGSAIDAGDVTVRAMSEDELEFVPTVTGAGDTLEIGNFTAADIRPTIAPSVVADGSATLDNAYGVRARLRYTAPTGTFGVTNAYSGYFEQPEVGTRKFALYAAGATAIDPAADGTAAYDFKEDTCADNEVLTYKTTSGGVVCQSMSSGGAATSFPTDSGTATPSAGVLTIAGGTNGVDTVGSGSTVTINFDPTETFSAAVPVGNGGTNLTASLDDNVMVGNGTTWQSKAVTDCDATGSAVNYDTATNAWSCQALVSGTNTGDQNIFQTVTGNSGSAVADTTTDTLTLTGAGITNIVCASTPDTCTVTSTEAQNLFQTIDASSGTDPVADSITDTLIVAGTAPIVVTGSSAADSLTITVTQNAGTDITADLEEETHATEHSLGGTDPITVTNLASACSDAQVIGGTSGGTGVECQTDDDVPEAGDYTNLTGGAGIVNSPTGTIATASGETDFLASGALTCTTAQQGRMQVHTTPLQYCDNAATPTLRYAAYGSSAGVATSATALAADGANCSAGNYPLGVDASGAVQSCTADDDIPDAADYTNLTGGAGIVNSPTGTVATASDEADFLKSGALTCGAATQGKMEVHTTPLQYCDNTATPVLRYAAYGSSTGVATTATALAADGANCSAGSYPLGVDASGAVQSCTAAPVISGTNNTMTKFTSTTTIGNANETDDGTTFFVTKRTAFKAATATSISTNQNNWDPGDTTLVRVTTTATDIHITGIANGTDGRQLQVMNVGTNSFSFDVGPTASTDSNEILAPDAPYPVAKVFLGAKAMQAFVYDATVSRWRVLNPQPSGLVDHLAFFADSGLLGEPDSSSADIALQILDSGGTPYDVMTVTNNVDAGETDFTFAGNLLPDFANTQDLGNTTTPWGVLYTSSIANPLNGGLYDDLHILTTDSVGDLSERLNILGGTDQSVATFAATDVDMGGGIITNITDVVSVASTVDSYNSGSSGQWIANSALSAGSTTAYLMCAGDNYASGEPIFQLYDTCESFSPSLLFSVDGRGAVTAGNGFVGTWAGDVIPISKGGTGWTTGSPSVSATGRASAQTAANTSVATFTVGGSDGSFEVSANVLVTTATLHSFTVTATYTDEGSTSRTVTLPFSSLAGAVVTSITNAGGAVPYAGLPLHIRAKASTAITIKTAGTFTTTTYNVEGTIIQTN